MNSIKYNGKIYKKIYDQFSSLDPEQRVSTSKHVCSKLCSFYRTDSFGGSECVAPPECWGCKRERLFHWEEVK